MTLYTIAEVAKIMRVNKTYVYKLINNGLLPVIKLGSYKVRDVALDEFLTKYEGMDLTDVNNVVAL